MDKPLITSSKRLVYNTFFNILMLTTNAVVGFILIGFFLGRLGEERYGIWVLIGSIFRYSTLLNMGLNSAINKYIPEYLVHDDNEGLQKIIGSSFLFFSTLAIVLGLVSILLFYNIGSWFTIKAELVNTARVLVLIVGFSFSLAIPLQLFSGILTGLQRYDIVSLGTVIALLLRTALIIVLVLRGYGLITMGLVFGASEIIVRIIQYLFIRRLLPQVSICFKGIDLKLLKEMLFFGINTFLYTMAALILFKASDIIIGIFLGTAEITQFAIVMACVMLLSQFLHSFMAVIKPAVSELDARNDEDRLRQITFLTKKYSICLMIPGACFLVVMGREFLWIWVGGKFENPAIIDTLSVIMTILVLGHCLRLAQHSNFLVLVGRGEHKIFGILTFLMAVLCVCGSVIAVGFLDMGLMGIAWANFIPMAIIFGVVVPVYFNRKMGISVAEDLREVWRPAFLGSLPAVILIIIWKYASPPATWLGIAMVVFSSIILTGLGSWFFSLTELERKRFRNILLPRQHKSSVPIQGN